MLCSSIAAQTTTPAPTATSATAPSITAVSDCHAHATKQYVIIPGNRSIANEQRYCVAGTAEYEVKGPTATTEFEAQYTDCHSHGSST